MSVVKLVTARARGKEEGSGDQVEMFPAFVCVCLSVFLCESARIFFFASFRFRSSTSLILVVVLLLLLLRLLLLLLLLLWLVLVLLFFRRRIIRRSETVLCRIQDVQNSLDQIVRSFVLFVLLAENLNVPQLAEVKVALLLQPLQM